MSAQRRNIALVVVLGLVGGGALLGVLPRQTFSAVAPVFILLATLLFVAQPVLSRRMRAAPEQGRRSRRASPCAAVGGALYGGYFGASQGVIDIAALFLAAGHVDYLVVLFLAVGSVCGGFLDAAVDRRLPDKALRALVVQDLHHGGRGPEGHL